jgi:N-acetylmuramic acid 6-phosphate etherase
MLHDVDLAILLDTGPELLTGSTRMKAGTSQKLALNRITTAAMVVAGRVVGNLMVELRPTNTKMRRRCIRIVCELAGTSERASEELLEATGWDIRAAAALAHGTDPGA